MGHLMFPCTPPPGEEGVCDETETEAFLSVSQGSRDIYTAVSNGPLWTVRRRFKVTTEQARLLDEDGAGGEDGNLA